MVHRRIRPFNTKDTYPGQNLDNDLSQAVVARGRLVFLRGQCPQKQRLWEIYKPQMDDYVERALKPEAAPGYGVAGEKEKIS